MSITELNPVWLDAAGYVTFLNRSFPGRWDRAAYDWYIAREFSGVSSDIFVRAENRRILSGMAMGYRQIRLGEGRPIDVGVVSAAATLPCERGRGHYSALLQAAIERAREKGYVALLGFVTHDNSSGRGLVRIGARAIPSFYIVSGRQPCRTARKARVARISPTELSDRALGSVGSQARFHYGYRRDWMRQFIHRPHPVRALHVAHDSVALVESVGHTDRLQWLACPREKAPASVAAVAAASAATGRRFFTYTLDPLHAAAAQRLGLQIRRGFMMLLPVEPSSAAWRELAGAAWQVHSGDRL